MARGCFLNASSTHHTMVGSYQFDLINRKIVWRRYNGYVLCFAEMAMTAENRFSGKTVMTLFTTLSQVPTQQRDHCKPLLSAHLLQGSNN